MVILRNPCIFLIVLIFIPIIYSVDASKDEVNKPQSSDIKPSDSETELLDKEYGVRYADACEGKRKLSSYYDFLRHFSLKC